MKDLMYFGCNNVLTLGMILILIGEDSLNGRILLILTSTGVIFLLMIRLLILSRQRYKNYKRSE